jgi:hypothetical protein
VRGFRVVFLAVCFLLILPTILGISQDRPAESTSLPFRIGERLIYTIKWDPPWYLFFLPSMEAGEADLQLIGETEYKKKKVIQIVIKARSSGSLSKLAGMKVEDEFTFFSDPATFCTLAVSQKIREGKRKRQIHIEYLHETRQLHFIETDEAVVPPHLKRDVIKSDVPSCVQDPFSALYSYRMSALREQHTQTFVLGDNDKIKEVQCRAEKQEKIEVPAGKYLAWKISTSALMGGLFKEGGQFRIWLSADERKTPIQFEVRVRLGRVLGKLKDSRYQIPDSR